MKVPKVSSRTLRIQVAFVCVAIVLALLWYAGRTAQEGQRADDRTDQRDAAVGAAEGVIDCIVDPTTQSTDECEAEAQDAQETLEEKVPPVGLTARQRREVVLIAAELIASDPELSEADIVDEVLARIPAPEAGDRGRRGPAGPAGVDGEPPPTEEVRALVEAVYDANPPAPGDDGAKGDTGTAGQDGRDGKDATDAMVDAALARYCSVRGECVGPTGPAGQDGRDGKVGDTGPAGATGAPGRGVASISCDSVTPFTLTVTYDDGTSTTYSCNPEPLLR